MERSGKHAAPRHAAQPARVPAHPVRIHTDRRDAGAGAAPSLSGRSLSGRSLSGRSLSGAAAPGAAASVLPLALGITAAVVAWGYLVYLAIDFGTAARNGDTAGWWLLALATIGAIACLFVGMLLGSRFVTRLRAGQGAGAGAGAGGGGRAPAAPRVPGGRRAAR